MVDPWFARFRRDDSPRLRLLCFPFAGGSAAFFRSWQARWSTDVEVAALQLPGRGPRFHEAPFTSLAQLLDAIVPSVVALGDRPFAFFGHSMGARVAFELTRRLRAEGGPMPVHLFVSGAVAPELRASNGKWHTLSDDALIDELRRLGGTPEEVLRNHELMQLMLPLVRADFAVLETHRQPVDAPLEAPLDVPIDALGGIDDPAVKMADLDAWRASTTKRFGRRMYSGGHFYLEAAREAVLNDVVVRLNEHIAGIRGRDSMRRIPISVRDLRELRAS